jgi:hypothetical protein
MPIRSEDEIRRPRGAFERTVSLDFDAAPELLRDSQPSGFGVEVHVPASSALPELYRVPAVGALETRKAGLTVPEFFAVEESPEGFVQAAGKGLYRRLRDVLSPASFEPIREVVPAKELAGLVVMGLDHLQHFVVKPAAFCQRRKEQRSLNASRIKAVFERLVHRLMIADVGALRTGHSPGRLKATALCPSLL